MVHWSNRYSTCPNDLLSVTKQSYYRFTTCLLDGISWYSYVFGRSQLGDSEAWLLTYHWWQVLRYLAWRTLGEAESCPQSTQNIWHVRSIATSKTASKPEQTRRYMLITILSSDLLPKLKYGLNSSMKISLSSKASAIMVHPSLWCVATLSCYDFPPLTLHWHRFYQGISLVTQWKCAPLLENCRYEGEPLQISELAHLLFLFSNIDLKDTINSFARRRKDYCTFIPALFPLYTVISNV